MSDPIRRDSAVHSPQGTPAVAEASSTAAAAGRGVGGLFLRKSFVSRLTPLVGFRLALVVSLVFLSLVVFCIHSMWP